MTTPNKEAALSAVADAVGGLMEFWGFKRNMGRMWTVLYLAPDPLSAADLCERLSLSTGAVSMTAEGASSNNAPGPEEGASNTTRSRSLSSSKSRR